MVGGLRRLVVLTVIRSLVRMELENILGQCSHLVLEDTNKYSIPS